MFESILWVPKISSLKESLSSDRDAWIKLVMNHYKHSAHLFGDIKSKDKYYETIIFPVSAYQIVKSSKIALMYGLLEQKDAQKFFPMLAEVFCSPERERYNKFITRYENAVDAAHETGLFNIDIMTCMLGRKNALIGSLFLMNGKYEIILELLTAISVARIFNNVELYNEVNSKLEIVCKQFN